jgi:general secretion pathway protein I
MTKQADGRGFTLVEVLVALFVVSVALTAVMTNVGQSVNTTIALRERTIAMWVAKNRLATHYLENTWPSPDTTEGTSDMGGSTWRWREQVATTPDADIRRIEIEIRGTPEREVLARLVGFLPKPNQ